MFVAADTTRVAALLSLVAGTAVFGFVGFAVFFLVLGGTMVPRGFGAPAALDWAYGTVLLAAAWAAQLDLYLTTPGLDLVVHAVATGLVAAMGHRVLVALGLVTPGDSLVVVRPRLGAAVTTGCLGLALAALWELGEWVGHTQIDQRIQVGYTDTVSDLAAGAIGGAVAAVLVARRPSGRGAR
jgi:hypothetical protein